MTEGLAIEIARLKMRELGIGDNYLLRFRHFILAPGAKLEVKGDGHLFLLLTPDTTGLKVKSKTGAYDLTGTFIELQYVHSGTVQLENGSGKLPVQAKLLQVIPHNP